MEDLDLEMFAPYISMDDDFQLRSLSPDEALPSGPVNPLQSSSVCLTQELHSFPTSPFSLAGSCTASPAPPEPLSTPHLATILAKRYFSSALRWFYFLGFAHLAAFCFVGPHS